MKADTVAIVEAGYAPVQSDDEWVARICDLTWSTFRIGKGCLAYLYDASAQGLRIWAPHQILANADDKAIDIAEAVSDANSVLPEPLLRALYEPSPPTALASEYIRPDLPQRAEIWARLLRWIGHDVVDVVGVRAGGSDRRGLLLAFPLGQAAAPVAWRTRAALDRVAAHLAAAWRLRGFSLETKLAEAASAVITPDGRVEHLADEPDVRTSRGRLVDAVRKMEWARGPIRRHDAEQSLQAWRALVAGHWSVVEFVDRDGKRFILARRNEPRGRDLLAITDPERQVLELASLGHANKLIAYELGIARSTVTLHLKRALRKLGLANRAELIALRRLQQG